MSAALNALSVPSSERTYPPFSLERLLRTVFEPTQNRRICLLIDFPDLALMTDNAFLNEPALAIQRRAWDYFYKPLHDGVMKVLGLSGGDMFAYRMTYGSNLDMDDECRDRKGNVLSLETDVYPDFDIILCISTFSATAPLTAMAKKYNFRGATLHGVNEIILNSGLAVDYNDVSRDAERLRRSMTRADEIEIDFALESGEVLTAQLMLGGQEAQKSHGLCRGLQPDVANLPAGEVYFVPVSAEGQFPLKYEDGTLGRLIVTGGRIVRAELLAGNAATIETHNAKLTADPMTGVLGELGFGTQVLPVSGADIQDEKILGTCHLATGRDDHLGGHLTPDLFKDRRNATHDDILFAPHKTPNFDIRQVRMKRGDQREILIEHFKPARYLLEALAGE